MVKQKNSSPDLDRRFVLKALGVAATCPLWAACEFVDVYETDITDEVAFDINDEAFQALSEVGGTACLDAGALSLLLIRRNEETIIATERFCPHQNFSMGTCGGNPLPAVWDPETEELTCRWHQSVFGPDGTVKRGPSPRGLRMFLAEFDSQSGLGRVFVSGQE